jgi:hypothetical protein
MVVWHQLCNAPRRGDTVCQRCRYQVGVCGHRFVLLAREGGGSVSINMPRLAVWRRRSSMCAAESKLNAYRLRVRVLRIRKTLD